MAKYFVDYNSLDKKEKQEYDKNLRRLFIMMGIATFLFYVLPFILNANGNLGKAILMLSLIIVFPIYVFGCGMIDAAKTGGGYAIPLLLGLFFVPTSLIMYGPAWAVLGVMYFAMGMFGELTGYLFKRRKKNKRQPIGLNRFLNSMRKASNPEPEKQKTKSKSKTKKNKFKK